MMEKLLGILPYIYFFDEPVQLGAVNFIGVPDWQGRSHIPKESSDRKYLQELFKCFPASRGLASNKGVIRAMTYFLLTGDGKKDEEILSEARKSITLLRYALLRPDFQALNNIESTVLYAFELPPASSEDYRIYHGWVNFNQEVWVSPKDRQFPPPGWDVDFQIMHTSNLEDLEQIRDCFYIHNLPDEADILLAMEWYNQSFQKYSIRDIAGRLVDVATAFETLFRLPQLDKKKEFKKRIRRCLGLECQPLIEQWATDFYGHVRSETLHSGKPLSLLFKHPDAQLGHLSFLWSAQRIFRECMAFEAGLPRHIPNNRLLDELTPNEVHLSQLRKAGSFENIKKDGLLTEIYKLRQIYPVGKREDIIWLGKELLRAYKEQFMPNEGQILPTLDLILDAEDSGIELGLKYVKFAEEFKPIISRYIIIAHSEEELSKLKKAIKPAGGEQWQLESAIDHFAKFAWWALLLPA